MGRPVAADRHADRSRDQKVDPEIALILGPGEGAMRGLVYPEQHPLMTRAHDDDREKRERRRSEECDRPRSGELKPDEGDAERRRSEPNRNEPAHEIGVGERPRLRVQIFRRTRVHGENVTLLHESP